MGMINKLFKYDPFVHFAKNWEKANLSRVFEKIFTFFFPIVRKNTFLKGCFENEL